MFVIKVMINAVIAYNKYMMCRRVPLGGMVPQAGNHATRLPPGNHDDRLDVQIVQVVWLSRSIVGAPVVVATPCDGPWHFRTGADEVVRAGKWPSLRVCVVSALKASSDRSSRAWQKCPRLPGIDPTKTHIGVITMLD